MEWEIELQDMFHNFFQNIFFIYKHKLVSNKTYKIMLNWNQIYKKKRNSTHLEGL